MIPPSFSFHWTGVRSDFEKMDDGMRESNKKVVENIQRVFGKDYLIIVLAPEDIANSIFVADDALSEIDISVMVDDDYMMLRFIYDGELYDPFENDELLHGEHIRDLNNFNHAFNYHSMFDMNFSYSRTEYVAHLHQLIFLQ